MIIFKETRYHLKIPAKYIINQYYNEYYINRFLKIIFSHLENRGGNFNFLKLHLNLLLTLYVLKIFEFLKLLLVYNIVVVNI